VNPQFANIVSPSEVVIVSSIHVELDGGGGNIHITMPYSLLEPIRELLDAGIQSDRSDVDERWTDALGEEVRSAEVEVSATMAKTSMILRDVLKLKDGDIIPIDLPEFSTVYSENVPLFKSKMGVHNDQLAIKIMSPYERPEHIDLGLKIEEDEEQ